MNEGKIRFEVMLESYPSLYTYWDFENYKAKVKSSEGLPLSSGEKILMDFFLSVWFHKNSGFELIRAAGVLSTDNKRVITDWFLDPFWP